MRNWDKEYHQIREECERATIILECYDTNFNAADVLTKSLSELVHTTYQTYRCTMWFALGRKQRSRIPTETARRQNVYFLETRT